MTEVINRFCCLGDGKTLNAEPRNKGESLQGKGRMVNYVGVHWVMLGLYKGYIGVTLNPKPRGYRVYMVEPLLVSSLELLYPVVPFQLQAGFRA